MPYLSIQPSGLATALSKIIGKIKGDMLSQSMGKASEMRGKFSAGCPSPAETAKIQQEKNAISEVNKSGRSQLNAIKKVPKTLRPLAEALSDAIDILKKIPIPQSVPPGAGIPVGISVTFADLLNLVKETSTQLLEDAESIEEALKSPEESMSDLDSNLSSLDVSIQACTLSHALSPQTKKDLDLFETVTFVKNGEIVEKEITVFDRLAPILLSTDEEGNILTQGEDGLGKKVSSSLLEGGEVEVIITPPIGQGASVGEGGLKELKTGGSEGSGENPFSLTEGVFENSDLRGGTGSKRAVNQQKAVAEKKASEKKEEELKRKGISSPSSVLTIQGKERIGKEIPTKDWKGEKIPDTHISLPDQKTESQVSTLKKQSPLSKKNLTAGAIVHRGKYSPGALYYFSPARRDVVKGEDGRDYVVNNPSKNGTTSWKNPVEEGKELLEKLDKGRTSTILTSGTGFSKEGVPLKVGVPPGIGGISAVETFMNLPLTPSEQESSSRSLDQLARFEYNNQGGQAENVKSSDSTKEGSQIQVQSFGTGGSLSVGGSLGGSSSIDSDLIKKGDLNEESLHYQSRVAGEASSVGGAGTYKKENSVPLSSKDSLDLSNEQNTSFPTVEIGESDWRLFKASELKPVKPEKGASFIKAVDGNYYSEKEIKEGLGEFEGVLAKLEKANLPQKERDLLTSLSEKTVQSIKGGKTKEETFTFKSSSGQDYKLEIMEEKKQGLLVPKRYAVAKDKQGTIVLRGPSSYSSSTEVLLSEIKFRIENQLP